MFIWAVNVTSAEEGRKRQKRRMPHFRVSVGIVEDVGPWPAGFEPLTLLWSVVTDTHTNY